MTGLHTTGKSCFGCYNLPAAEACQEIMPSDKIARSGSISAVATSLMPTFILAPLTTRPQHHLDNPPR